MSEPSARVLFRCDGGPVPEIGTGHVRRCLLLAEALRSTARITPHFLMYMPVGIELVRGRGFPVTAFTGSEVPALEAAVQSVRPRLVVFDELDTTADAMRAARSAGAATVATFDDRGAGSMADLWINGILEAPGATHNGPDYVVLGPAVVSPRTDHGPRSEGLSLFLSFGGHDHNRFAQRSMEALRGCPAVKKLVVAVAGTDVPPRVDGAGGSAEIELFVDTPRFAQLLRDADLAIVAGGLTVFEAMRLGVPAVVISQYPHQLETAERYQQRGSVLSLGLAPADLEPRLRSAVEKLAQDPDGRARMGARGRALVDGGGLERVIGLLRQALGA